jgi:hypothetical protein
LKGIGPNEFRLKRINGRPVGIEERLEAVHDAHELPFLRTLNISLNAIDGLEDIFIG